MSKEAATIAVMTAVLALFGAGVSAGSGFEVTNWVLLFWGLALALAVAGSIWVNRLSKAAQPLKCQVEGADVGVVEEVEGFPEKIVFIGSIDVRFVNSGSVEGVVRSLAIEIRERIWSGLRYRRITLRKTPELEAIYVGNRLNRPGLTEIRVSGRNESNGCRIVVDEWADRPKTKRRYQARLLVSAMGQPSEKINLPITPKQL